MISNTELCRCRRELPLSPRIRPPEMAESVWAMKLRPYACLAPSGHSSVSSGFPAFIDSACLAGMKPEKSNVPSCRCVTGMSRGRSSAVNTSVKAERAAHTVASGAWNGGLIDEMIDGVKTRTFGGIHFSPIGWRREVSSGRNACIVIMGCRRWVLKRSENLEGGIVAMGEVW